LWDVLPSPGFLEGHEHEPIFIKFTSPPTRERLNLLDGCLESGLDTLGVIPELGLFQLDWRVEFFFRVKSSTVAGAADGTWTDPHEPVGRVTTFLQVLHRYLARLTAQLLQLIC
jgi:hypothetical protein